MKGPNDLRAGMRSALVKGSMNLSSGTSNAKDAALEALGGGIGSSPATVLATVAVAAGIEAIRLGYATIEAHKQVDKNAYDLFVRDYNTGTVSFFLPDNESDRTGSQRFFHNVMQLFQGGTHDNNSLLCRCAGIYYTDGASITLPGILSNTTIAGTYFSLISSANVVFAGGESDYARDEDPILDVARQGSDVSLLAQLPLTLATIYNHKPRNPLEYNVRTGNLASKAIRRLDLVRFWTIAFANLLITLQNPPELDDKAAIALCEQVKELIDTLLLANRDDRLFGYLQELYCAKVFTDFLSLTKREVEALQFGYKSKMFNQLSLSELVAQSRGILQEMNILWHRILYLDKVQTEPVQLLHLVRSLSLVLEDDPAFWDDLSQIFNTAGCVMPRVAGLSQPYSSVIDLIVLIASVSTEDRADVLSAIPASHVDIKEFLQQLDLHFMAPLAQELQTIPDNAAHAFLINLIALSTESRPPFLKEPQRNTQNLQRPSLQRQFSDLNDAQLSSNGRPAFGWSIWACFEDKPVMQTASRRVTPTKTPKKAKLRAETIADQGALLRAEYVFLDALRSLCALEKLLDSNRNLLLHADVRKRLRKVLVFLGSKEDQLKLHIQKLYNDVNTTDKIDHREKDENANKRRQHMLHALSDSSKLVMRSNAVRDEINNVIRVLDSPEFSTRVRQELAEDVADIMYASHTDYQEDMERLLVELQVMPQMIVPPPIVLTTAPNPPSISSQNPSSQSTRVEDSLNHSVTPIASSSELVQEPAQRSVTNTGDLDANLRLQWIWQIVRAVSAFLLVAGVLTLLALTFGASSLSFVAALTANQVVTGMVMGGLSTVAGAAGLAASYYFFRPAAAESSSDRVVQSEILASV